MKKLFFLLMIVMLGFSGCSDDEGLRTKKKLFTVRSSDWELIGDEDAIGSYYLSVWDVPELTEKVYTDGLISCYYIYTDNLGYIVQTPLPFFEYDMALFDECPWEMPWSVYFSYDITPGSIAFKVVFSDFYTGTWAPPTRSEFRLVLVY